MPVHLYGHRQQCPSFVPSQTSTGSRSSRMLLQAHDASLDGTPVGTFGTFAAFSFYPTKNMTSGEGGMVVTADSPSRIECDYCEIRVCNGGMRTRLWDSIPA